MKTQKTGTVENGPLLGGSTDSKDTSFKAKLKAWQEDQRKNKRERKADAARDLALGIRLYVPNVGSTGVCHLAGESFAEMQRLCG